jgi:hypothetical protein
MYHVQDQHLLQKHPQQHGFFVSFFFPGTELPEWIRQQGLHHWSTSSIDIACPSALRIQNCKQRRRRQRTFI